MIKWIKVFFLGVFIWFLLSFLYGFTIGILDLDTTGSFENNLILLPDESKLCILITMFEGSVIYAKYSIF